MKSLSFGIACLIISVSAMAQNVGIGTTTPKAKLHVSAGASGALPHSQAGISLESNNHLYLHFLTLTTKEGGIMFGNTNGVAQGGVYYNNPSNPEGLDFRTNGNIVRMEIDNAGNVEMKNGLTLKGNFPTANATLVSKDQNGTTAWQKAYAFRVEGLYESANVNTTKFTTNFKLQFQNFTTYNIGLSYSAPLSEFTAAVKGIYHISLQVMVDIDDDKSASTTLLFTTSSLTIKRRRGNSTITIAESTNSNAVDGDNIQVSGGFTNIISQDFLLEAGDIIWAELSQPKKGVVYGDDTKTSFSGRLVTQIF